MDCDEVRCSAVIYSLVLLAGTAEPAYGLDAAVPQLTTGRSSVTVPILTLLHLCVQVAASLGVPLRSSPFGSRALGLGCFSYVHQSSTTGSCNAFCWLPTC